MENWIEEDLSGITYSIAAPECRPIWFRHTLGRGVVLTWKDSGAILDGNYYDLIQFIDRWNQQEQANTIAEMDILCRQWKVDYMLLDKPDFEECAAKRIVFSNIHWTVVQVNSPTSTLQY